jgi:hypothetical protein
VAELGVWQFSNNLGTAMPSMLYSECYDCQKLYSIEIYERLNIHLHLHLRGSFQKVLFCQLRARLLLVLQATHLKKFLYHHLVAEMGVILCSPC